MLLALRTIVAIVTVGFLLSACGGDSDPTPKNRSMAAPTPAAERAGNRAPFIEGVTLVPNAPRAGDPIEATVQAEDPDADGVRLSFSWSVNGREMPEQTRTRISTLLLALCSNPRALLQ